MQRDEPSTGGLGARRREPPAPEAYVVDRYEGEIAGYYLGAPYPVNRNLFDASVPVERRVTLVDTDFGDATAYDAANLINQMARSDYQGAFSQPYWTKGPPGPWLIIGDDSRQRIVQRARRLSTASFILPDPLESTDARAAVGRPGSAAAVAAPPVAEPSESMYVRDPTPTCQILPSGSPYEEVYDFYDPSIERAEFEREVPPTRRVVLRSGNVTTAYDAAQLLRAAKGVGGNWDRTPEQRNYVLLTPTGSCLFGRDDYLELVRRSTATDDNGQDVVAITNQRAQEADEGEAEEEETRLPLASRPAPSVTRVPTLGLSQRMEAPGAALARVPLQQRAPVAAAAARTRRLSRPQPMPLVPTQRAPASRPVPPVVQPQPSQTRQVAAPPANAPQATRTSQAVPFGGATWATRVARAVRGLRQGDLMRLVASPDFVETINDGPLAADMLAETLALRFVIRGDPLPIVLTSLAVRSLGAPPSDQIVDAAIIIDLAKRDALSRIDPLRRAGFDPSDDAIVRSIVERLSGPEPDPEGAVDIINAFPFRDPANYRRVLAAATRLGFLGVVRYVAESVLRDSPITRDEATLLADIATQAGERAIASLFLLQAAPMEPVPVSADYREREREYRGEF
ncbi:hypothetical protein psal_cds_223 [Pandoravirus salinus]|uniref:Uncharacterized protein n=1 Tax=Pandoravirus salinus TaxID=1349410 RepID=S4VWE2_9VIRU|nr:hypothetical protein psal_cds_223 [Pandoravirus salinus]AGO83756.1 hypothetical protein psal_cds_223 [Pandoravirus salinus]